jgi:hypothetical protein
MVGDKIPITIGNRIKDENLELSFIAFDKNRRLTAWCPETDVIEFIMRYNVRHYNKIDIRTFL